MASTGMHADEVPTDVRLVRRLLRSQHPDWADLPIEPVVSAGTDNAMFRLGEDLAVRLPRIAWAVDAITKEQAWVPKIAAAVPLSIPLPVATGAPRSEFPYPWSVVEWLPGELAELEMLADPIEAAHDLARFVLALRELDPTGGPQHTRGAPVRLADEAVRRAIESLVGEVDAEAVTDAWEGILKVPDYDGPPLWFHGDLAYLNLLALDGRLASVIDWGTCGVGDPAIDSMIAWTLFSGDARSAYRGALNIDDATWDRGKGWVLTGVIGIPYYRYTNPTLVENAIRGIKAVLSET